VKTFERPRTETQRLKPLKMPEPAKSGYIPEMYEAHHIADVASEGFT
jgi:hypothetical protein